MRMEANINLSVTVDISNLAEDIVSQMDYQQTMRLIQTIDERYADWQFTENMYIYFKELHEIYLKEKV